MPLNHRFAFFTVCARQGFGYEHPHRHRPRANPIQSHLSRLYEYAELHGVRVLFTQCVGGSRLPLGEFRQSSTLMVRHDAKSSDWMPQLDGHREIFVERPSYGSPEENQRMKAGDVFYSNPSTTELVGALDVAEWVVFGVAMQACVSSTVRGLLRQGQTVTILSDAVLPASHAELSVEQSLEQMRSEGARVETTEAFFTRAAEFEGQP